MGNLRFTPARSVIVGYGRAGSGLHHRSLRTLFGHEHPVLAVDPLPVTEPVPGGHWMPSLADAIAHLEASGTSAAEAVFHVATCPSLRPDYVEELVERGARRIILEKPIATTTVDARRIARFADVVTLLPVSVWLASRVTRLTEEIILSGEIGEVRGLHWSSASRVSVARSSPACTASASTG